LQIYGEGAVEIVKLIADAPDSGKPMHPKLPYTQAEIIWICRNEMPVTIEDVLARRTRALFLNARASNDIAPEVARLMAEEIGHDLKWRTDQVELYKQLISIYL
jgi:glycerol-3-phosphate dehydrogenase